MDINRKNPDGWNADIDMSVDFYNQWFLRFALAKYHAGRKLAMGTLNFQQVCN